MAVRRTADGVSHPGRISPVYKRTGRTVPGGSSLRFIRGPGEPSRVVHIRKPGNSGGSILRLIITDIKIKMINTNRVNRHSPHKHILKIILLAITALAILTVFSFFVYVSAYYHADDSGSVAEALVSDEAVAVEKTEYGWFFDGPSGENLLVFYPGAKVEETAYAPFLHLLAERGMDVCLVKMPFHLAVFGVDRAEAVLEDPAYAGYRRRYVGGHSLGGAMAASFAASHMDLAFPLDGVILCAAYPAVRLEEPLRELVLYGSEDGVLNMDALRKADDYAPADHTEYVIRGGNHAQFGDYGIQKGDGEAVISARDQQEEAVEVILQFCK